MILMIFIPPTPTPPNGQLVRDRQIAYMKRNSVKRLACTTVERKADLQR
jgi:hypothetical protein